ncbi:hypothetical protein ACQKFG_05685 [Peribacillus sp. NPDC076916]|uniref:hypothetical protein n=1 Tax=Peribacillus sp. NPDC076916 TaxID=3390608 RepID=UPI003D02F780
MDIEMQLPFDVDKSNPIFARLGFQTGFLISNFPLTAKQKDEIFELLGIKVCERLVSCYEIYSKLQSELNEANETKNLFSELNFKYTPNVKELRIMCEDFLYQAKSTLRDLLKIYKIFYNEDFSEAHYDEAYKWAKKKFGEKDDLYRMLKKDNDTWIKKFIFMRNAVEHPNGWHKLTINNIKEIDRGESSYFKAPTWQLDNEKESPILADMEVFIENALVLSENSLVSLLKKLPGMDIPLLFVEIPEDERNANCPVRFQTELHPDYFIDVRGGIKIKKREC